MTRALHDNSGQADLALLNQTLSDFAVTAQQELACIALQQLHGILYCHELGAERFPTIDKEGCILACMHMLGTFTVPASDTVNLHHELSLHLLKRRQKYCLNMLTSSLTLHLPKCPLAYSRCHSVLRTRLALPLLQSASLQSRKTSQPRSSSHGCRVRAMTTQSTEDASKSTATEMKQVGKRCDTCS